MRVLVNLKSSTCLPSYFRGTLLGKGLDWAALATLGGGNLLSYILGAGHMNHFPNF